MAKTKKTKKTEPKFVEMDGKTLVKFHKDAGLNGTMYTTGQEALLTPEEMDSHLAQCFNKVVAK